MHNADVVAESESIDFDLNQGLPRKSVRRRVPDVVDFLRAALIGGAVLVSEIEARARRAGLLGEGQRITAAKLFKRAKAILGIQSIRQGFGPLGTWAWTLPPPDIVGAPEGVGHLAPDPDATVIAIEPTVEAVYADMPAEFRDVVGVPRSWLEGVARLDRRAHRDVVLHRWRQFVADCHRFIVSDEGWARRAADLGWDGVALFGCSPINPLGYLGIAGLLWNVGGGRIIRLRPDGADIQTADGQSRTFRRRRVTTPARVTLPWLP
jgi:hypothetical protein